MQVAAGCIRSACFLCTSVALSLSGGREWQAQQYTHHYTCCGAGCRGGSGAAHRQVAASQRLGAQARRSMGTGGGGGVYS